VKKLLLNSIAIVALFSFISCCNTRNNTTIKEVNLQSKQIDDTLIKSNSNLKIGDTTESKSSNTESSTKGSNYREFEVKHNSPNQAKIDSIKKAKTKGKR
jgi:hypothetical protein